MKAIKQTFNKITVGNHKEHVVLEQSTYNDSLYSIKIELEPGSFLAKKTAHIELTKDNVIKLIELLNEAVKLM